MFRGQQTAWVWVLGANAVLFNPVLPVRMARTQWETINLLDAFFFAIFVCVAIYHDRRREKSPWPGNGSS
jgi:hypothetical protein